MSKEDLKAFVTKLTTALKAIFPLKTQVATDIEAAKTEVKAYADTKTAEATNDAATNASVDTKIAALNATITTFQGGLDDRIDTKVASLGTFVGIATKFANLPTTDQNNKAITAGDFAHLTAKDGSNKKGLYRYDGAAYVFVSGDPAVLEILSSLKYASLDVTVDDKFVTPKWVKDYNDSQQLTQEEVDAAVAAG